MSNLHELLLGPYPNPNSPHSIGTFGHRNRQMHEHGQYARAWEKGSILPKTFHDISKTTAE